MRGSCERSISESRQCLTFVVPAKGPITTDAYRRIGLRPRLRAICTFVVMGPGSRSRSLSSGGASRRPVGSLVRDDVVELSCASSLRKHDSAISRRDAPEFLQRPFAQETEGVGNAGRPMHPQPRVRNKTKHTSIVTTGPPGSPGIPARNGFNGFLRALPGDRACLSPSSRGLRFCLSPVGPTSLRKT